MNSSFTLSFIQCMLNADSVPGFVREASMLALGFSRFCFQALSLPFRYFSSIFPPLKAEAPYTPWIWAPSKARGLKEPLGQGSKTMNKTKTPTLWGTCHGNKG